MSFQKNKRHLVIVGFIIIVILPTLQDVITNVISSIIFEEYIQGFVDKYFPDKNWLFYLFLIGSMIIIVVISILLLCHTSKDPSSTDKKQRPLEIQDVPVAIDTRKFKGRHQDLEKLHQGLEKSKISAISGLPGVGKSELAKQYAHKKEYNKRYENIFWISSELADKPSVKKYWSGLSKTSKPILVIFHDCYNFEELRNSLPSQRYIKVLITTPLLSPPPAYVNYYHRLKPLSEEAAIALLKYNLEPQLREKVDTEIGAAKALCKELGYLPIALKAASDFIQIQHPLQRFSDLRDSLQADAGKFSDINHNSNLQIIDHNTLRIYNRLWNYLSEAEKRLAYCISFFASGHIPAFLIDDFAKNISNSNNIHDSQSPQNGYKNLWSMYLKTPPDRENQSLQDLKQEITIVALHPIVRKFFNLKREDWVNQLENPEGDFCYIIAKISRELPQDPKRNGITLMEDLIVPHLEVAATLILKNPDSVTWFHKTENDYEAVTLLEPFIGLAKFYKRIGKTGKAIKWLKRCERFLSKHRGKIDRLYTRCLYSLAYLYKEEEYYQIALNSAKNNLEKNDKFTGLIHKNFGRFYYNKTHPDYQLATEQFQAAIRIYSYNATLLGQDEHQKIKYERQKIICQCYLAQAQCCLRNFKAADKFYASSELERFIEQLQSSDNKQDKIDCSRIEYERAECYRLRKDFYQGAQHSHKALKIREKYLQDETAVAQSLIQLAQITKRQKKFRKAEGYYGRALTIYKKDPQISNESLSKIKQEYDELLRENPHLHLFKSVRDLIEKQ
ncbi:MAG: tetratricopeptide repeat protein [Symploca sp. SIO2C1]|nr:tetratricopeptide repeat protein [Symploca sp. SIO2C1]